MNVSLIKNALFLQKKEILEKSVIELKYLFQKHLPGIDFNYASSVDEIPKNGCFQLIITPFLDWLPAALNIISKPIHIHFTSSGIDILQGMNLNLEGVKISSSKGVNAVAISEYVMGGIISFAKKLHVYRDQQNNKLWKRYWLSEISGLELGIIGVGSVGSEIAKRAKAFNMSIYGVDIFSKPSENIDYFYSIKDIDKVLERVDFVVLSLPLNKGTFNLIDENKFNIMKSSAILINVSRGQVVNENSLLKALQDKNISGAMLDVFNNEPLRYDHPFWDLDNVIITPHVAGTTQFYMENMITILKREILYLEVSQSEKDCN